MKVLSITKTIKRPEPITFQEWMAYIQKQVIEIREVKIKTK